MGLSLDLDPLPDVCTTSAGTTVCDVSVVAPPSVESFVATFYDAPNGTGNALSTATVPAPAVVNGAATVGVTLEGLVSGVVLNLTSSLVLGQAGSTQAVITALDADGDVVGGSAAYAGPITLTSSGAALAVTPSSVTAPATVVTLTYDGTPDPTLHLVVQPPAGPAFDYSPFGVAPSTPPPGSTPGPAPTASGSITLY